MHLIWHIIRKDLSGTRWLLLVWLALNVTPILVGWWALGGSEGAFKATALFSENLSYIWIFVPVAMTLFITVSFVHEDRLIGMSSHWPVLPVSGGRLLAAKVSGLLLVLWVLPVFVALPWWLANRFGVADILQGVLQQAVLVVPAMMMALMVASLTGSYGRFLVGTLALYLILMVGFSLAAGFGQVEPGAVALRPDVRVSRRWLALMVVVTTMVAVVIHQYLRRRLTVSIGLLALGGGVTGLILTVWPWSIVPRSVGSATPTPMARPTIQVQWGETTIRRAQPMRGLRPGMAWIMIENVATTTGLGPREAWTGRIRSVELKWADGTVASFGEKPAERLQMGGGFVESEDSEAEVFRIRHRVRLWFNAEIPESLLAKMVQEPPTLSAEVDGYVHRGDLLAEVPITGGNVLASGSLRMEIVSSERTSPFDQTVVAVMTQPARPFWRSSNVVARGLVPFIPLARGTVFNRSERAAVRSAGRWGGVNSLEGSTRRFAGVEVARRIQNVTPPTIRPSPRNRVVDRDEGWLDDASYVWTRAVLLGRLNTSFEANPLTIPAGFDAPFPPIGQGLPPVIARPSASMSEPGR